VQVISFNGLELLAMGLGSTAGFAIY